MVGSNLKVVLPPLLAAFYSETGYCDPADLERRQTTRLNIRCEAALNIQSTPVGGQRSERNSIVLIKDISKRGINILAHEPIELDGILYIRFQCRQIHAKVVRCRRLGEACWEVGAKMLSFKNLEDDIDV